MNIDQLKTIVSIFSEAGYGDNYLYSRKDVLMFSEPGEIDEDSELGKKLLDAGALYDEDEDGWYVYL